ncbi:unnamed protein product [Kluyveromyces dobzhanskii CBS 2104]|uniref:WGS project CCBQ000000000 data, contig 00266 n=1 Tax=Kluyveromyces dobzhanskii CBS 2104 TaxID=1427455 RepID=A0A0A8L7G7_9SACH|nr:unnamed protein product [Kluyveromyces dobzhanskii CBS 2104]
MISDAQLNTLVLSFGVVMVALIALYHGIQSTVVNHRKQL